MNKRFKQICGVVSCLIFLMLSQNSWAQKPTQTIRGTVLDADTQLPLAGATISLIQAEHLRGAMTDSTGKFRLENVEVGFYKIEISFLGYATLFIPELLLESGNEQVLEVQLEREEMEIQPLVLYAPSYSPASIARVSKQVITVEEARRFPATFDDPARLALSYPGVVSANDQANNISVRGNSPASLSWYLEGVEIVNPNHLGTAGTANDRPTANGGGVNILSAQLLGASTFLSGAFPANYGNSLSGIMDMQLRKGNSEQYEFTGQIGLIGIDLAAEGPFSKKSDASFLANYRYSTLGILSAMGVDLGDEAITFQDFSFNLNLPTQKAGKFSLFGIGGRSSNVFVGPRDTSLLVVEKDQFDITSTAQVGVLGATHLLPLGKSTWRTTLAYSTLESSRVADQLDATFQQTVFARDTLEESKLSIQSNFSSRPNDRVRWQLGATATLMDFRVFSTSPTSAQLAGDGGGWLLRPYANLRVQLRPEVEMLAGVHYSYFTFNESTAVEPRASLRWVNDRQQLSLAYGLHSKLQPTQLYFLQTPEDPGANQNLGFTKAHHIVLSHQFFTGPSARLRTELYYQQLFNVPETNLLVGRISAINWEEAFLQTNLPFRNTGTGRNYGLEVSWQQYFSNSYYYLANASVFDSRYSDDETQRNTRFNSNYLVNLTGGKEFSKNKKGSQRTWGINLRISYIGGLWETPIDEVASANLNYTVFDLSQAFTQRQPDVFKVDSRFYFRKDRRRSSTTIALDLQNMTNQQNLAFRYYDTLQGQVLDKYQLGLIPNLSWRMEF